MSSMEEEHELYYKIGEMHGDVKAVLVEAKKTNGRVTRLEEEVSTIKTKIAYYSGAAALGAYLIKEVVDRFT